MTFVSASFRTLCTTGVLLAGVLVSTWSAGCAPVPTAPKLAKDPREAEIAVTNLTPYPWRIAVRSPEGVLVKSVDVQPRETFAVVLPSGEYVVEQMLLAGAPVAAAKRSFAARFEPGERYRWNLATLLTSGEPELP